MNENTGTEPPSISRSTARLRVSDTATAGWDAYDFRALPPPATDGGYALAGFPIERGGDLPLRAVASDPYEPTAPVDLSVPLHVEGVGLSGPAAIAWPEDVQLPEYVPADWSVELVDTAPGDGSGDRAR